MYTNIVVPFKDAIKIAKFHEDLHDTAIGQLQINLDHHIRYYFYFHEYNPLGVFDFVFLSPSLRKHYINHSFNYSKCICDYICSKHKPNFIKEITELQNNIVKPETVSIPVHIWSTYSRSTKPSFDITHDQHKDLLSDTELFMLQFLVKNVHIICDDLDLNRNLYKCLQKLIVL